MRSLHHLYVCICSVAIAVSVLMMPAYAETLPSTIINEDNYGPGNSNGWIFVDEHYHYMQNGHSLSSQWINTDDGFWYYLDENGNMATGWLKLGDAEYYLCEQNDGVHPLGACFINEMTPDGSQVDGTGAKVIKEEPVMRPNPYGASCVEVDITNQMVYCYIGSELRVATPCVTGQQGSHNTKVGAHSIKSKERSRYLQGYNDNGTRYKSWVEYWMPFYGGQGLHDASWRNGNFGGNIYTYSGSHGCVNMPIEAASQIYSLSLVGMPVYVHL